MGGAILTLVSRVKKLERTVKQLRTARLVGDAPATEGDVDIQDEVDLEGFNPRMASEALGFTIRVFPLRLWRNAWRRRFPLGVTEVALSMSQNSSLSNLLGGAGPCCCCDKGKAPMPDDRSGYSTVIFLQKMLKPGNQQMDFKLLFTHELGISPFADSADSSSPSPVSTDHIPLDVLFEPKSGGINEFFLDSDEATRQDRLSRVAADPDSDDEVLAEILFRGQYISGAGVVVVDKLPDDEIVDPRLKTFFSSESESDEDMENYIPPIRMEHLKIGEGLCRLPLSTTYYHVYYQENRRQKSFFYLKQLLPHVYREDLLLLRRRMNRTQDEWVVSSWKLYPRSSVHVLDLTNGKTVYMFVDNVYPIRATLLERMLRHRLTVPPSYCRDVVVAGNVIQTVQAGLRESYECLASAPLVDMVINPPWNLPFLGAKGLTSPEQTATAVTNSCCKDWKLLFFNVAACFVAAGYLVSAGTCFCCYSILLLREDLSRNLELTESKPIVPADSSSSIPADNVPAGSSSSIPAEYVSAGHVLVSADRDRIC
ncbi:hypothetical protein Tco_0273159 [Tanacetum coccineum]